MKSEMISNAVTATQTSAGEINSSVQSLQALGHDGHWHGQFWHVEAKAGILTACLDCHDEKVNTLTRRAIEELGQIVAEQRLRETLLQERELKAVTQRAWKGLIITTPPEKPGIAGANILEINQLVQASDANAIINATESAKAIFLSLSKLSCPTVAAMNGNAWLGGGLELAAFCDYRIATAAIKVGLPEVKIGIFPGFGGTQTIPRLFARLTDAVDFVTSGKNLSGPEAFQKGLIDEIVDESKLWNRASSYCRGFSLSRNVKRSLRRSKVKAQRTSQTWAELKGLSGPLRSKVLMETLLPSILEHAGATGRHWLLQSVSQIVRGKTILTSPLAAAELVMKSRDMPFEEALAIESSLFAREALSPFAKGLLSLFIHKEGARDVYASISIPAIENIAIVGAGGPMGAGIAALYAACPQIKKLVLIDIKDDLLQTTLKRVNKHLTKLAGKEIRSEQKTIVTATDYSALVDCDVIIEAVPENVDLKVSIYKKIASVMATRPIQKPYFLYSNTSALDLNQLTIGMEDRASNFAGLHFFNPPEAMQLVEVPRASATTNETMAVGLYLAAIAGKAPIPCANMPGFVVNRILGAYLIMTAWLLSMGVSPEQIDKAMKHAGAPLGPATLLDQVGVDIAGSVAKSLSHAFGNRMKLPQDAENPLKILLDMKDLGQKTGRGIWVWEDGKPARDKKGKLIINSALKEAFPNLATNRTMSRESIQYLLLGAVINEALRAVEDGVVAPQHLKWIDVAFSLGTGIDAVYGGPLHHLDAWGVRTFERLSAVISRCGNESWRNLFAPCTLLTELAEKGESFRSFQNRMLNVADDSPANILWGVALKVSNLEAIDRKEGFRKHVISNTPATYERHSKSNLTMATMNGLTPSFTMPD